MMYIVKEIYESDYGCEERMYGGGAVDAVILVDAAEDEITMEFPDEELVEQDIREGDWVSINKEGKISKVF